MNAEVQVDDTGSNDQRIIKITKFSASYMDKFMDLFRKLPIPYWSSMIILIVLQTFIMHILAWSDGSRPVFTFEKLLLLYPVWLWGPIGIMMYLNSIAQHALEGFRSLIPQDDQAIKSLNNEFSTMRNKGLLINGLIWLVAYLFLNYVARDAYTAFGLGNTFALALFIEGLISYLIGGAIYYHSLRQLLLVHRIVKMVKNFNLFHLDPVYSFSRLTSMIGIVWVLLASFTLLLFPLSIAHSAVIMILVIQIILATAAFVLPLSVIHQRLVIEKRKLLAEHNLRMQQTLKRLHTFLDEGDLEAASALKPVLESINFEFQSLMRIPTWPWRSGTLTGFVTSILLPVALFLIQVGIRQWLGV